MHIGVSYSRLDALSYDIALHLLKVNNSLLVDNFSTSYIIIYVLIWTNQCMGMFEQFHDKLDIRSINQLLTCWHRYIIKRIILKPRIELELYMEFKDQKPFLRMFFFDNLSTSYIITYVLI